MLSKLQADAITDRYNDRTYLEANKKWHAEDSPWKAAQILRLLRSQNIEPTTVAEVGCGAGEIILNLAKVWPQTQLDGYELSRDAFDICKPKECNNVRFHLDDLADLQKYYDLVMCIDVFEHVENYIEFLRRIKGKGARTVFHIPLDIHVNGLFRNGFMRARRSVGHLHYFTAQTALATLRDAGYEIEAFEYTAVFASDAQMTRGGAAAVLRLPRRILFSLAPDFLSKTLGGCSLLVLAK